MLTVIARSIIGLAACMVVAACQAQPATVRPTIETSSTTSTVAPATNAPPPSEIAMATPESTRAGTFTLTSTAFDPGGSIPRTYACDGKDISPPLAWSALPAGTKALGLIVSDPDAGGFVHWLVFNVDAAVTADLPAELTASAAGVPQGRNSFGDVGYNGPCPPSGTHHYVFRILALDSVLELTGTPEAGDVLDAAAGHILGEAQLTGTYRKGG